MDQRSQAAEIRVGNMDADRILFLGNSITYHWPNADLGWSGSWGMASTSAEKDYAHRVVAAIGQIRGGALPAMKAVNVYDYGRYEANYAGFDAPTQMAALLAWKPDIVVVELGENMSVAAGQEAAFYQSFANLLTTFKYNNHADIFVRNLWYPDAAKDALMKRATEDVGAVWVDLGDLESKFLNRAESQGVYTGAVGSHPSDQGMQAIADGLVGAMKAHGVPEPGTLTALSGAGLLFAAAAAKRRIFRNGNVEHAKAAMVCRGSAKSE
jgi:lysophospholipase L1-like esterase